MIQMFRDRGCNFSLFSFYLGGKRTYWGLPNNPDYELGPMWGSACDSLTNKIVELKETEITLYPNPFQTSLYIRSKSNGRIIITDVTGRIVFNNIIYSPEYNLNLHFLQTGIYHVEIITSDGIYKKKISKIS